MFFQNIFSGCINHSLATETLLKECGHHFQWDTWNLRCMLQLCEFGVLHGFLQVFGW